MPRRSGPDRWCSSPSKPFQIASSPGKSRTFSPAVDQTTRTFPVEALVENPDRVLKPGFFAKGVAQTRLDVDVLAAPDAAISTLAGVSTVYVIEAGKARQQQVTLGARDNNLIEIIGGLKGDEILATSNLNQLATGVSIRSGSDEEGATASEGTEGSAPGGGRQRGGRGAGSGSGARQ